MPIGRYAPKSEPDVGSSPTFPTLALLDKRVDVIIDYRQEEASMPPPPSNVHYRLSISFAA